MSHHFIDSETLQLGDHGDCLLHRTGPGSMEVLSGIGLSAELGKRYYADAVNGNDSNDGLAPSRAVKTVAAGYALLRSGYYDTLYLIGLGTAFALTATLTWAKDYTRLIGISAPIQVSGRARITNGASTNLMTPMVTFTGTGIEVRNIQFFQGGDHATSAAVCVLLDGCQRSYFQNCHFAAGGQTASAGNAAMRSLVLDGGAAGAGQGENVFQSCTIGLDTVVRGNVANVELELRNFATRNIFKDCLVIRNGGAGGLFLKVGASGLQRFVMFKDTIFHNDGTALTNATSVDAAPNGNVIMIRCLMIGMTSVPANAKVFADPEGASTVILKGLSPT